MESIQVLRTAFRMSVPPRFATGPLAAILTVRVERVLSAQLVGVIADESGLARIDFTLPGTVAVARNLDAIRLIVEDLIRDILEQEG